MKAYLKYTKVKKVICLSVFIACGMSIYKTITRRMDQYRNDMIYESYSPQDDGHEDVHCIKTADTFHRDKNGNFIVPSDDELHKLPFTILNCLYKRITTTLQTHCSIRRRHGNINGEWTICQDSCYKPSLKTNIYVISTIDDFINSQSILLRYNITTRRFLPNVHVNKAKQIELTVTTKVNKQTPDVSTSVLLDTLAVQMKNDKVYKDCAGENKNVQHSHMTIPEESKLRKMNDYAIKEFYNRYLTGLQIQCKEVIRLGLLTDGGWNLCYDYPYRPTNPCLVYSFGVDWDFSFDDDVAKTLGCEVHSFDPSMLKSSYRRSENVWFHQVGISNRNSLFYQSWKMNNIETILKNLQHSQKSINILKLDIEFSEWEVLPDLILSGIVNRVTHLLVEFHGKGNIQRLRVLRQLYNAGFRIYWYHINPATVNLYPGKYVQNSLCYEVYFIKNSGSFIR